MKYFIITICALLTSTAYATTPFDLLESMFEDEGVKAATLADFDWIDQNTTMLCLEVSDVRKDEINRISAFVKETIQIKEQIIDNGPALPPTKIPATEKLVLHFPTSSMYGDEDFRNNYKLVQTESALTIELTGSIGLMTKSIIFKKTEEDLITFKIIKNPVFGSSYGYCWRN